MRPTLNGIADLPDTAFNAVHDRLGVTIPEEARMLLRSVNGARPTPRRVRFHAPLFDDTTEAPVYEFFNVASPDYLRVCAAHWDELGVPRQFLPFASADQDTFFLDLKSPDLRVLYWAYLEGDYGSHFQGEEMDCVADSATQFLNAFIDEE